MQLCLLSSGRCWQLAVLHVGRTPWPFIHLLGSEGVWLWVLGSSENNLQLHKLKHSSHKLVE
jgi:hypothetical protein